MRPIAVPRSRLRRSGFTLVELLVAVGLTSVMLWGIFQLFTSATRFSSTVTAEAELCATTRAILERVTRELSSAATLNIGYLRLIDGEAASDAVQFVAPVRTGLDRVELAHVRFDVDSTTGMLRRSWRLPYEDWDTPKAAGLGAPPPLHDPPAAYRPPETFGLKVQWFNVGYVPASGGTPKYLYGTKLFNKASTSSPMPGAVVVEIQVVDPKGRATLTMSSSAPLMASGL